MFLINKRENKYQLDECDKDIELLSIELSLLAGNNKIDEIGIVYSIGGVEKLHTLNRESIKKYQLMEN